MSHVREFEWISCKQFYILETMMTSEVIITEAGYVDHAMFIVLVC